MNIKIKIIDKVYEADINIPNEPFSLFGRMIPSYVDSKWSYTTEKFDTVTEMCFPDENYNYDELAENHIFVGAYDGDKCIGLAILRHSWFKYMYLYDLKVSKDYRRQNIGELLIEKAKEITVQHGYNGLYTQGQDDRNQNTSHKGADLYPVVVRLAFSVSFVSMLPSGVMMI